MVYPNAPRIKRGWIRECAGELPCAGCCGRRPIWLWKRLQERSDCRRCSASGHCVSKERYLDRRCLRLIQSRPLIRKKNECSVFPDWPTHKAAKIVVMFRSARIASAVREPIVRIHCGVAKVFVDTPVELICT